MRPLADEIRPQTLDEVAGQKHLLGEGALLRRLIENGAEANLIFYGPSGTGKTTIANIIAKRTQKALYHLNATTASLSDIKAIIADVDTMLAPNGILLYLDEIQYFNKKQQQSLLEFLENGKITMIASTTENPYFYIYNALLSRSTVFEFKPLTAEETRPAVERALKIEQERSDLPFRWEDTVPSTVAAACGGDVRKAVTAVELLYQSAKPKDGVLYVTSEDALQLAQRSAMRYDRDGDEHYDLLSALQKSIRGSDPDAAVYYLGRLLGGGRPAVPLPPPAGHRQRGYRPCLPPGHRHHEGLCGRGSAAGPCRRRGFHWPRRLSCWPRRPSPTPAITPSSPLWRTSSAAPWAAFPGICRTSTPTAPDRSGSRATSIPTCSPTTTSSSGICRRSWGRSTTMNTATTRPSRPPNAIGTRSRKDEPWICNCMTFWN